MGQPVRVDARLGGQLGEIGRRAEPFRNRVARRDPEKAIALEVKGVEDDPRRVVDVTASGVEVVERAGH
jgi:hypothetical protein